MSGLLRENGPVLLVPSAWGVVGATHMGVVSERSLLIAHGVMATILFAFAVLSRNEMSDGVLRVWLYVLVAGFFFTVAGTIGLAGVAGPARDALLAVSIYGWMFAPAAGLAYTAGESDSSRAYAAGAVLSVVGASAYTVAVVGSAAFVFAPDAPAAAAVIVVGVGQTVGIADAVYRY